MSLGLNYNVPYVTAGTKQFETLAFKFFQYKDSVIKNKVFFDDSTLYPLTATATGTITQKSTGLPTAGEVVYSPTATAPLVFQSRDVHLVEATAADDGVNCSPLVTLDMTYDNFAVIVVKSSGTSVAGKVKFSDSSGTDYSEVAFTTSATANTWEAIVLEIKDSTNWTNTPDFSDITDIDITLDTLGTDVTVAMVYGVNNLNQVIGTALTLDYTTCPSAATMADNFEKTDLVCKQLTKRKIGTSRAPSLDLTNKTTDLYRSAVVNGSMVKRDSQYVFEKVYGTGSAAIATATISAGAGLIIGLVKIGEKTLTPVSSAGLVDANSYHYDSSTGTMTFDSSLNGSVPTVWAENSVTIDNFDVAGLELGYLGRFYMTRVSEQGRKIYNTAFKAQISGGDDSAADDGDETNTIFDFLSDSENRFYNKAVS